MKTSAALASLLALSVSLAALLPLAEAAEPTKCEYVSRPMDNILYDSLPKEIVGYVNCDLKLNLVAYYVARFDKLDQKKLMDWFEGYEDTLTTGVEGRRVIGQSSGGFDKKWLNIETKAGQARTIHHLFVNAPAKEPVLVYLYTDAPVRATKYRERITMFGHSFAKNDYSQKVRKLIESKKDESLSSFPGPSSGPSVGPVASPGNASWTSKR